MNDGEPAPERAYILEVLGEASKVVQEIPVSGYERIGRGSAQFKPEVLIPHECASASRQHAVLDLRGDRPVLEDRSRFGTLVNGSRVEKGVTELSDRDEIIFGLPGDGWRVRFRYVEQHPLTVDPGPADPLEWLIVTDDPRQVRIGPLVIEENLGRDAFVLFKFMSENRDRWYPTDRLVNLLWSDPDKMPIAAKQTLSKCKRRINDFLRPYSDGQDAIDAAPLRGYRMKSRLDRP